MYTSRAKLVRDAIIRGLVEMEPPKISLNEKFQVVASKTIPINSYVGKLKYNKFYPQYVKK